MTDKLAIHIHTKDLICPNCGATELSPESKGKPIDQWKFQIKAFRVDDWSHCLMCHCWFDLAGNVQKD